MSQSWNTMFDQRKWAMVPDVLDRKEILRRLREIKSEKMMASLAREEYVATLQ